jgi:hypothetical protein
LNSINSIKKVLCSKTNYNKNDNKIQKGVPKTYDNFLLLKVNNIINKIKSQKKMYLIVGLHYSNKYIVTICIAKFGHAYMLYTIVTYSVRYAMQNDYHSLGKGKTQPYTSWVK